jgi:hypothetical protein
MIRVNVLDNSFNRAYWNAKRTLPVGQLETPRQYGARWRETFKCRVESGSGHQSYYVFDCDEDYTWFMLKYG